ncbi:hypothetical protein NQ315_001431 [Exocentrus adspersus]|uniref:P-type domain-containing protein n=1 Tax=Exocentrus adspersus TaxID=1586481 RepID=A0AAV8WFE1_9CUCU|nr:hypothetical protein NQ315_001431 [Exocentrus adspersus]
MRIRDLLKLKPFQAKRARPLTRTDSVSFEAFCNDSPPEKYPEPEITESSLIGDYKFSPAKLDDGGEGEYASMPRTRHTSRGTNKSIHPSLPTILLVIVLSAVFIILPIVYLLNCFDMVYKHNSRRYVTNIKEADHYGPSNLVRQQFLDAPRKESRLIKIKSLPYPPKPDYNQCKSLTEAEKFDCFPDAGANAEDCETRGCCWIPAKTKPKDANVPLNIPYCFYPANYNTYNYINVTESGFGLVAFLRRSYRTAYPEDIHVLKMIVKYETETRLHIKMVDPVNSRFEPAYPEVPIVDRAAINLSYSFKIDVLRPGFKVIRKADNVTIFDANNFINMIYSNQFLQISTKLPSQYIYGLGEHQSNLLLSTDWNRFTLFNHDAIPQFNKNLYGSHPFYLSVENSSNSHGVFLLNSNAMDIILQPTPAITFRPVGGILDFYFFMGPTPSDVIGQYTELIGRPHMPPYWGLGFHLCRFGYKTLNETRKVMQRNINAGIPLDTQWNDLDYMNNSNDFTYDKENFNGLPGFVKDLHSNGMHYIPLIDPGVSASEVPGTYPPYDTGIKMDIFVKNSTGQPFIGKVWNKASTVWPDFTHPRTVDYWTLMLKNMHEQIPFDGAWIDMNEPSNFLSGSFTGCPKSSLESPPYFPAVDGGVINYKTMCMSAKHYGGLHYNIHNLYGFTEAIVTSFALAEIRDTRPMIISRSTFPGHGHYAGHWSGDIWSAWADMRYTIPQLLSFSLFGIPLMGADICGFNGNTTQSLCNRWMQLGAFYPFSRNHNTDDGIDQDPVAMGEQVVASSKKALNVRYSLLPYLYTLFYRAHVFGETVARPLFFDFTGDPETYFIDTQFLWGAALMIVPVLEESKSEVMAYLPSGVWYDFYTKSEIRSKGQTFNLSAPLDTIPLLMRGGYILPQQAPKQTTSESRKTKVQLLIASDENGTASGEFYWDDGDSLNCYEEKRYSLVSFELDSNVLRSFIVYLGPDIPPNLGSVTVLGIQKPVTEVMVNDLAQAFKFDTVHKYLVVDKLDVPFSKPIVVSWK